MTNTDGMVGDARKRLVGEDYRQRQYRPLPAALPAVPEPAPTALSVLHLLWPDRWPLSEGDWPPA